MSRLLGYPGHEVLKPEIVRAENCHLFDADGRKYVDLESGVWCTSVGHCHPRPLRALREQAGRLAHAGYCYSHPIVEEAAAEVLALLGFADGRCVFLCSGSEAVEYGVRAAQAVAGRPLLMTMTDSYFGAYGSAAKRSASEWFSFDWLGCVDCPETRRCDERCERWAAIPHDRIGGFLFEPGSSSGLVRFPPNKLIQSIDRSLKAKGGLFVVNEITTGVGRTGRWFGHQHYEVAPDIVAMGKGLGNGYPVAATALSAGVAARLGGQPIKYAQSHQNDPLGAAVVLEVIRTIRDERLIERAGEIAALLADGLAQAQARTGLIRAIRARGLMIAVELHDDATNALAIRTHAALVEQGFVIQRRPGLSLFRIDPSLTVERQDIEAFLAAFEAALTRAAGELATRP